MRCVVIAALAFCLAVVGCATSEEVQPGPAGAGGSGSGTGGSGGGPGGSPGTQCEDSSGSETSCDDPLVLIAGNCTSPDPDPSCTEGTNVNAVLGVVTDESGIPVQGAEVEVFVTDTRPELVCLRPEDTDAGGYQAAIPVEFNCATRLVVRAKLPTVPSALGYCEADLASAGSAIVSQPPTQTFNLAEPTTLPPVGDSSLPRIVVFGDGLEIDVVPDEMGGEDNYNALAGIRVPLGGLPPCIAEGRGFAGLYAFSPEVPIGGPGFGFTVPNTTSLPAGTRVGFEVISDFFEGNPDAPLWNEFGTGTVLPDGSAIASDEGSELPYLSWLGYRPQ